MLENIFGENWKIIVPLIGAGLALVFPQLKPIIDKFVPPSPQPPDPPGPSPFFPLPPTPPTPSPTPTPTPADFTAVIAALQLLVAWFKLTKNEAGEKAIRTAGRALFNEVKSEE